MNSMRRLSFVVAAIVSVGLPTSANADPAYEKCIDRASTSYAYNGCAQQWLRREEAALAIAWKRTYQSLRTNKAKVDLLQEQRNWIKYKDSVCRFYGNDEFGSRGWSQLMVPCIVDVVQVRVQRLNEYGKEINP